MKRKVMIPHLPTKWDAATEKRIPSVNLNPATDFGKLVVVYDDMVFFNDAQPAVNAVIEVISELMTQDDYILCVGDPILGGAAMAAASRLFGYVNVLRWDKSKSEYEVVEFSYE